MQTFNPSTRTSSRSHVQFAQHYSRTTERLSAMSMVCRSPWRTSSSFIGHREQTQGVSVRDTHAAWLGGTGDLCLITRYQTSGIVHDQDADRPVADRSLQVRRAGWLRASRRLSFWPRRGCVQVGRLRRLQTKQWIVEQGRAESSRLHEPRDFPRRRRHFS
eukprot:scaffold2893_cov254-Pinguiococcus_pyrenoidosus.AAC.15